MWEEHPSYQKQQAAIIGLIVLALVLLYLGYAAVHRDWDLFTGTLKFAAALLIALGILSGSAWVIVRLLTRRGHSQKGDRNG